jgi:hypothetical protein
VAIAVRPQPVATPVPVTQPVTPATVPAPATPQPVAAQSTVLQAQEGTIAKVA